MQRRTRKRQVFRRQKQTLIGRFLRRRIGMEQICDRCSRPYLTQPAPDPVERLVSGSAVASVFVEESFGRVRHHVQLGRYAANGHEMFITQMIQADHLEDIARVALMARHYIDQQQRSALSSRR